MRLWAFVAALVALPALASSPFQDGDHLVFLGDSNTEWGSYHTFIGDTLGARYPETRVQIVNEGLGGDTLFSGYYWRFGAVFARRPEVVFILFGLNDFYWGNDRGAGARQAFLDHAGATVAWALMSGVREVYFVSYPVTDLPLERRHEEQFQFLPEITDTDDSFLQRRCDEAMFLAERTCVEGRCGRALDIQRPMRRVLERLRANPLTASLRMHHPDGGHLNAFGNEVVGALLLEALGERDALEPVLERATSPMGP